jgi:hypothetical protein
VSTPPHVHVTDDAQTGAAEEEEEREKEEDLVGADDKLKPFLVPGDEIRHRYNCARVQGVYAFPGLLLLGEGFLYMIDNYRLEQVKILKQPEGFDGGVVHLA